jgi:excisionase family DNA binding protein
MISEGGGTGPTGRIRGIVYIAQLRQNRGVGEIAQAERYTLEPGMSGELLRVTEAARMLAVDPSTLRRWINLGLIDSVKLPSGHYRIPRGEVERLLKRPKEDGGA